MAKTLAVSSVTMSRMMLSYLACSVGRSRGAAAVC
jgi:hypothetical protein